MNTKIESYRTEYEDILLEFWNRVAVEQGYVSMNRQDFQAAFTNHPYWRTEHVYLALSDGECMGFACGCSGEDLPFGDRRGYLTCLIISNADVNTDAGADAGSDADSDAGSDAGSDADFCEGEFTGMSVAGLLMAALEASFRTEGLTEVAVNCFNPMKLSWRIEGECLHNNCPGVAMDLDIYGLLRERGYETQHEECAMFLDLGSYEEDEKWLEQTVARAAVDGYMVEWYRTGVHRELKSMVDSLQNPMWSAEIPEAAEKINMLVALQGDRVVGFTGPVYPERSGRGYFAGIAVSAEHERHGLGTLLFLRLLAEEKKCGSRYMSLFTGTDNNARKIYERAGFTVKRRFATMLKQL